MQLQADEIDADLEATLEHLAGLGFERTAVGVVGFCMGGSISFVAGAYWKLGAAVTFYGGGITQSRFGFPPLFDLAPTLQTPWLGLFGDLDASIPIDEVEGLSRRPRRRRPNRGRALPRRRTTASTATPASSYHEASAKDGWAAHALVPRRAPRLRGEPGGRSRPAALARGHPSARAALRARRRREGPRRHGGAVRP